MDAPIYPPASGYEQPVRVQRPLSTRTAAIAELLDDAEARAIVEATIPGIEARVNAGPLAAHRDALSLRGLAQFGIVKNEGLDRVDAQLAQLNVRRGLHP